MNTSPAVLKFFHSMCLAHNMCKESNRICVSPLCIVIIQGYHCNTVNTHLPSLCVRTGRIKIRTLVFHSGTSAFKFSGYYVPSVLTLIKCVYFAHSLFFNFFVTLRKMAIIFVNFFPGHSLCEEGKDVFRRFCKIAKGDCHCDVCLCTLNSSASLDGYHEVLYVSIFRKSVINTRQNNEYFTWERKYISDGICSALLRKRIF